MPKDCTNHYQTELNHEASETASNERDSLLLDIDSDADEGASNGGNNSQASSSMNKINGNKLEVVEDNFDGLSEQSKHSEWVFHKFSLQIPLISIIHLFEQQQQQQQRIFIAKC